MKESDTYLNKTDQHFINAIISGLALAFQYNDLLLPKFLQFLDWPVEKGLEFFFLFSLFYGLMMLQGNLEEKKN